MLFAIDQQQYLQGYLPVVFAVLFVTNLNTVGNGAPVLTGPRDHQQGERRPRGRARREGHPLERRMADGRDSGDADPDERLVRVGPLARILTRPDIGAFLGAVAVFFAFAYFARGVNWIGDPGIAAGWTDQAAQFGIVAVPVALLMIGGEFDLSAGAMIGSSRPPARLPRHLPGREHLAGDGDRDPLRARDRLPQRPASSSGRSCRASSSRSRPSSSCRGSTPR